MKTLRRDRDAATTAADRRYPWVTAYLLAVGLMTPLSDWLSDRYGRKQIFVVALVLFLVGSTSAALAPGLGLLITCRVVQGAGGGLLAPVGMALVYELFPPNRRGTALGVGGWRRRRSARYSVATSSTP